MPEPDPAEPRLDLISRAISGDRDAWQELVQRYSALVWSVIRKGGLSRERGEDVFQEVFAAALTGLRGVSDPARFDGWLLTIARRLVWREWEARRRAGEPLPEELRGGDGTPDTLSEAQETRLLVQRALNEVSSRCRQLLLATFAQGPPPNYDKLARTLGVPRGSMGPTRARCLEHLARALKSLGIGAKH
jgi:RNA polymerase sigma factor (sigma-70 family)